MECKNIFVVLGKVSFIAFPRTTITAGVNRRFVIRQKVHGRWHVSFYTLTHILCGETFIYYYPVGKGRGSIIWDLLWILILAWDKLRWRITIEASSGNSQCLYGWQYCRKICSCDNVGSIFYNQRPRAWLQGKTNIYLNWYCCRCTGPWRLS